MGFNTREIFNNSSTIILCTVIDSSVDTIENDTIVHTLDGFVKIDEVNNKSNKTVAFYTILSPNIATHQYCIKLVVSSHKQSDIDETCKKSAYAFTLTDKKKSLELLFLQTK